MSITFTFILSINIQGQESENCDMVPLFRDKSNGNKIFNVRGFDECDDDERTHSRFILPFTFFEFFF